MDKRLIVRQRLGCLYSKANESGKIVSVLINFYICSKFGDNYQLFDQFNWLLHNMCPVSRAIHIKICLSAVYDIYWKIHMVDLNQRFFQAYIAHLVNHACLLVFKQVWGFWGFKSTMCIFQYISYTADKQILMWIALDTGHILCNNQLNWSNSW
jgi:hypothetical protein